MDHNELSRRYNEFENSYLRVKAERDALQSSLAIRFSEQNLYGRIGSSRTRTISSHATRSVACM